MQGLLFLDAMVLVRYIFLFHMKNPTAVQVSILPSIRYDIWIQSHKIGIKSLIV